MRRKKNMEALIQIFMLFIIAGLLIYVMVSKKISYYVHPRYYTGIWISIVILLFFAVCLVPKIFKARHNVNVRHYLIFALPIFLAIVFPFSGTNANEMTIAEVSQVEAFISDEEVNLIEDDVTENDIMEDEVAADNYATDNTTEEILSEMEVDITEDDQDTEDEFNNYYEKYADYLEQDVIMVTDEIFAEWYLDVCDHISDFTGTKCHYLAQVYFMDGFEENQFLAGRYIMVCCAADMLGYGIICESSNVSELENNEWITVTGTINEYTYNGNSVPILTDITIEEAGEPEVAYVYYNFY